MTAVRGCTAECRKSMRYILHAQGHGKRDSPAMVVTWCRSYLFVVDVPLQLWCWVWLARRAVEAYLFSDLILLLFPRNVWAVLRKICQTESKPLGYTSTIWCRAWYKTRIIKFETWVGSWYWLIILQLYGKQYSAVRYKMIQRPWRWRRKFPPNLHPAIPRI
jgi:hypothetical protein